MSTRPESIERPNAEGALQSIVATPSVINHSSRLGRPALPLPSPSFRAASTSRADMLKSYKVFLGMLYEEWGLYVTMDLQQTSSLFICIFLAFYPSLTESHLKRSVLLLHCIGHVQASSDMKRVPARALPRPRVYIPNPTAKDKFPGHRRP